MEWSGSKAGDAYFYNSPDNLYGYTVEYSEQVGAWGVFFWSDYEDLSKNVYLTPDLQEMECDDIMSAACFGTHLSAQNAAAEHRYQFELARRG